METKQFSKEHLSAVLDAFIRVKGGEIELTSFGICYNASHISTEVHKDFCAYAVVETFSLGWPKHSGNRDTPCGYVGRNKWVGEHGALRYELLDYLIDRLTEELGRNEQKMVVNIVWYEGELPSD